MSDKSYDYKEGVKRGVEGRMGSESFLDEANPLRTGAERQAQQRGYEAGVAAKAITDAINGSQIASRSSVTYTPPTPWAFFGVTLFWTFVSIISFPWGTLGFLLPTFMGHDVIRREPDKGFRRTFVVACLVLCYGHLIAAFFVLWRRFA